MASAAQRFFAIPELLEQVLLEVSGNAIPFTTPHLSTDLYVLKSVNRLSAAAIDESPRIRLSMGLRGPLTTAPRIGRTEYIALTSLRQRDLNFPPFKYNDSTALYLPYQALPYHHRLTKPKRFWISYTVHACCLTEECQGSRGYRAGLQGKSGRTYHGAHHSWRKMRLAPASTPLVVNANVFRPQKNVYSNPLTGPSYIEWMRCREGEGTLGDLADFFEEIGQKTRLEQEEGSPRYTGAY